MSRRVLFWLGLIGAVLTGVLSHAGALPIPEIVRPYLELSSVVVAIVMAYLRDPNAVAPRPNSVTPKSDWPL